MKKLLLALALAAAPFAVTGQAYPTWAETQALTRSPADPNSDASGGIASGMSLSGVAGFRVVVSAESTRTITGGSVLCWVYSTNLARWARCPTALDLTLATGARDSVSADFRTLVGAGRVLYAASSVTVSGGTTVSVRIEAQGSP